MGVLLPRSPNSPSCGVLSVSGRCNMATYTFSDDVLKLNPTLAAELAATKKKPTAKYRNIPTEADGHRFASKKEAADYQVLKLLEQAGQIAGLRLQPEFVLQEASDGMRAIKYVADFLWTDLLTGKTHVKDSKGFKTKEFRIKEKLFKALYPQYVFEVG